MAELPGSLVAIALISVFPCVSPAAAQGAACATCVAVAVTPAHVSSLPASFDGMEVLLRLAPGEESGADAAIAEVDRRTGRPGLFVSALPESGLSSSTLSNVRRVLIAIDPPRAGESPDEYAFALKTKMTAVRAAAPPTMTLGIAADPATIRFAVSRALNSYVDFVVATGTDPVQAPGLEIWRLVPASATTVESVLALTRTSPETTHWLWQLPDDGAAAGSLVAELVRVAALPPGADPSQGDRVGESVQVIGARALTVEEIVARHQAAAARQSAIVRDVISTGTLTLSFEAPGFPAPISISSDTTIYTGRDRTEIEQRAIRINGIAFSGKALPRLPIIEPERVASPPLAIELTNRYRYRLDGRDTIAGTPCYVVAFEPDPNRPDNGRPLFRGQAWIAMDSFAMLKVAAAQTGLRGPIVTSEQVDEFHQVAAGVWLLAHSDVRQMYEGAAHRTPIHRVLDVRQTEVNPADFKDRRTQAYGQAALMLRDTPQGYRYLK